MQEQKSSSRLTALLLSVLMLFAFIPLLGSAVYADTEWNNTSTETWGVTISTDKKEYTEGDTILCKISGTENMGTAHGGSYDPWLGIYYLGADDGYEKSIKYEYTGDVESGDLLSVLGMEDNLSPGKYHLILSDGGAGNDASRVWATLDFTVKDNPVISSEEMSGMIWNPSVGPQVVSSGSKVFWGYMKNDGMRGVASYDKDTGTTASTDLSASYSNRKNDALSPALLLTRDNKLLCAYPQPDGAQKSVEVRLSNSELDNSSFSDATRISFGGTSIWNCQLVEGNGTYYLFARINAYGTWAYSTSIDGITWTAATRFLTEGSVKYNCIFTPTTEEGIIRVVMSSDSVAAAPEIRMGFFDTSSNKVYSDAALTTDVTSLIGASGTQTKLFENLPVVQAVEEGKTQNLLDVAITAPDSPRFLFASFTAGANDSVYKLYDNGNVTDICSGGDNLADNTQLGASFRGANDIIVARNADGKDIIEQYSLNALTEPETLYTYTVAENSRAARPIVDVDGEAFLWHEGTYTSATDFNTSAKLMFFDSEMTPDKPVMKLSEKEFFYNGSVQKPTVTIGTLIEGTDYNLTWSDADSTNAGTYTVTADFIGAYEGEEPQTGQYTIIGATIATDKEEYNYGDDVTVTCSTNDQTGGWVAVFSGDTTVYTGTSILWYYPYDTSEGKQSSPGTPDLSEQTCKLLPDIGTLDPGTYKIAYLTGSRRALAVSQFTITAAESDMSIDKSVGRKYKVGEPIKVTATSVYPNAWVGLYPYAGGDPLDNGDLMNKYYVAGRSGEEVDILHDDFIEGDKKVTELPPGRYKVILFRSGWDIDTNSARPNPGLIIESFYVEHAYSLSGFDWEEVDGEMTAIAVFKAVDDETLLQEVEATVTSEKVSDATCDEAGVIKYTATVTADDLDFLTEGDAPFSDTKEVEIKALGHEYGELIAEVPAGCETDGVAAHYECSVCHKLFVKDGDNYVEKTSEELVIGKSHDLTAHEAVAATCEEAGNSAYWSCNREGCGKFFSDEDGKNEIEKDSWVISALGHDLVPHNETAATCDEAGNSAYWSCNREGCGKFFSDEDGKNEIEKDSWIIDALGHVWGTPDYEWSDDNSEVTATRVCGNDPSHVETETAGTTSEVIKAPTYGSEGEMKYTAEFKNEAFEAQTKSVAVPKMSVEEALEEAAVAAYSALEEAGNAEKSTDEAVVSGAEATAKEAADLAAVAEVAADEALKGAQEAFDNLPADASDEEKEAAQNELNAATQDLAEAKAIKAAANSAFATAKKAAAKIAADKAASAAEAAQTAATPEEAAELSKQAAEAAGVAEAKANEAASASEAATAAVNDLEELAANADESVKEAVEQAKSDASKAAENAAEAASAAAEEKDAAASSSEVAKQAAEDAAAAESLDKTKTEAKAALDNFKNADDYRDAQKAELSKAIEEGKAAIDAATDEAGVTEALNNAKAAIETIKTDAQMKQEEEKAAADAAEKAKQAAAAQAAAAEAAAEAAFQGTYDSTVPKVKSVKAKAAKKSCKLSWKKANKKTLKKFDGIEVQYSLNSAFPRTETTVKNLGKKKTSLKVKGLTKGKTYYVRVRYFKNGANGKLVGAWKTKKVKIK